MKTFAAEIIPKLLKYSQKLDNLTILTNQHWVQFDNAGLIKTVWIFRNNNTLLISKNGIVEKGSWELLDSNSLLIETSNSNLLFKHGFFDDCILALKLDSQNEFAFFVNESKSHDELNSLEKIVSFLDARYLCINNSHVEKINRKTLIKDQNKITEKIQDDYKAPDFEILKKSDIFSLIEGNCEINEIKYSDGVIGTIQIKKKTGQSVYNIGQSFFNVGVFMGNRSYLYTDFTSCINGLHFYKTKKEILKKNLVEWYSGSHR